MSLSCSSTICRGAYRNCTEWKKRDGTLTSSATYSIDPDGVGGEDPINVTCKTDNNVAIITEIGHNRGG